MIGFDKKIFPNPCQETLNLQVSARDRQIFDRDIKFLWSPPIVDLKLAIDDRRASEIENPLVLDSLVDGITIAVNG